MGSNEIEPVSVEIVSAEDLSTMPVLGKVEEQPEGMGFIQRAGAALGMVSDVIEAAGSKNLYKVTVPDGYSLSDLISSAKGDGSLRALVKDTKGKLNGDVSLKLNGVNVTQIASLGFGAMAMVVGQAYMAEINDALRSIDSKLDSVLAMMAAEKKAKVKNAIDIARSYMQLHRDYFNKPLEARQAARNEIESRYNDVGEVVDWLSEQLLEMQKRASGAKASEKKLSEIINDLRPYDEQFDLCLKALSALAVSRMYYDGCVDEQSALVEHRRIQAKTRQFLQERQKLVGILELKIGSLKGAPVALPQSGGDGNVL